jgi:hypothetical protein
MTAAARSILHERQPELIRAMALYPLDPGHSDLDNEQPMSVPVQQGADSYAARCTLGEIRQAQREAGLIGHVARQAKRAEYAARQVFDTDGDQRRYWIGEAQREAAELGSALTRLAFASSVQERPKDTP